MKNFVSDIFSFTWNAYFRLRMVKFNVKSLVHDINTHINCDIVFITSVALTPVVSTVSL